MQHCFGSVDINMEYIYIYIDKKIMRKIH